MFGRTLSTMATTTMSMTTKSARKRVLAHIPKVIFTRCLTRCDSRFSFFFLYFFLQILLFPLTLVCALLKYQWRRLSERANEQAGTLHAVQVLFVDGRWWYSHFCCCHTATARESENVQLCVCAARIQHTLVFVYRTAQETAVAVLCEVTHSTLYCILYQDVLFYKYCVYKFFRRSCYVKKKATTTKKWRKKNQIPR